MWRQQTHFSYSSSIFIIISNLLNSAFGQDGHVTLFSGVTFYGDAVPSQSQPGRNGYAFLGIRYGVARRFEPPVENMDFTYLSNQSRPRQGPICPQGTMGPPGMTPQKLMNEDCLYLDVYVPALATGSDQRGQRMPPLPVMVYIYGGALQSGDKDSFNSSALADSIGAVIVTINYRVNVFGFLSTADGVASGNYGVADCKLALRWIHNNIIRFGGDPSAITIFGESAGATMVSALLLDPSIRRVVRGAVMMSGSVMVDTLYIRDPRTEAFTLGNALGCSSSTSAQLVACLKQLPMDRIVQVASAGSMGRITQKYGLVVDHDHIRDLPVRALQRETHDPSNGVSVLTGYLREDVSFLLQLSFPDLFDANKPLTLESVCDMIARQFLLTSTGSGQVCTQPNYVLAQRVMQHFNMTSSDTRQQLLWKLFQLGSESQFGYPAAKEASFYAQRGMHAGGRHPSSQVFRITYDPGNGLGSFHTLDIQHIFANPSPFGVQLNPSVTNSMRLMLRQMAYNGRMDGADFSQGGRYMELDQSAQWQFGTKHMWEMIRFWDEVSNTPCLNQSNSLQSAQ